MRNTCVLLLFIDMVCVVYTHACLAKNSFEPP